MNNALSPEQINTSTARHIVTSLLVVGVCWVAMRFGSLIVTVAITHLWGPGPLFSAYALLFRQLVMTFIYPSFLKVFRPAFIPLYNEIKKQEGEAAARQFAQGTMEIGMLLGFLLFVGIWSFPGATVRVLAPEFEPELYRTTVTMMRQMAPGILCLLFAEMYLMMFHAEKTFGYPHGAEAAQKILWGVGIFVTGKLLGWEVAAIGMTYAATALVLLCVDLFGMYRTFGWVVPWTSLRVWVRKWGKRSAWLVLPLLVGILGARARDLITVRLQSHLDTVRFGSVEIARQLTNLPVAFFGQIVSFVMLPHLAAILHGSGGRAAHRRTLEGTLETLWLLTIPIVAVTLVLSPELVALVYINVGWSPDEYVFCAGGALAVSVISLGFTLMMLENILLPGFFSIKSMWWPTLWGLIASGLQIVCLVGLGNAGLARDSTLLLVGVAVVYPFSRILKSGVLLLVLRDKVGAFSGRRLWGLIARMTLLLVATVWITALASKVTGKVLGTITTGNSAVVEGAFGLLRIPLSRVPEHVQELVFYKLALILQLAAPTLIAGAAFFALVLLAGYGQQMKALLRSLLARRRGKQGPSEGAA